MTEKSLVEELRALRKAELKGDFGSVDWRMGYAYAIDDVERLLSSTTILESWQIEQLKRIGSLIGGNWSGSPFDGRDIADWIDETLLGKNLDEKLKNMDGSY